MDLQAFAPKVEAWEDTTAVFPELDTMKTDSAKMAQLFHRQKLYLLSGSSQDSRYW